MHAFLVAALALGVSAAYIQPIDQPSDQPTIHIPRQFPKLMFCPGSGLNLTGDEVFKAAIAADRSGPPAESSAANLATAHCSGLRGIPLYNADLPKQSGSFSYAFEGNATIQFFYYCGSTSGRAPSGWPDTCKEFNEA